MASGKISRLLSGVGDEQRSDLAALWSRILRRMKVNENRFNYLLKEYLDRQARSTNRDREWARGTIVGQLTNTSMTWRTFMDAMRFLGACRLKLKLTLVFEDGREDEHQITLNIREPDELTTPGIPEAVEPERPLESTTIPRVPKELSDHVDEHGYAKAEPGTIENALSAHVKTLQRMRQVTKPSSRVVRDEGDLSDPSVDD